MEKLSLGVVGWGTSVWAVNISVFFFCLGTRSDQRRERGRGRGRARKRERERVGKEKKVEEQTFHQGSPSLYSPYNSSNKRKQESKKKKRKKGQKELGERGWKGGDSFSLLVSGHRFLVVWPLKNKPIKPKRKEWWWG